MPYPGPLPNPGRLAPENVIVLVQEQYGGHRYDAASRLFAPEAPGASSGSRGGQAGSSRASSSGSAGGLGEARTLGTGHCMLQVCGAWNIG